MKKKNGIQFDQIDKNRLLGLLEQKAEERQTRPPELPLFESEYDLMKELIRREKGQSMCPMNLDMDEGLTEIGHDPYDINKETRQKILNCFLRYIKDPRRKIAENDFYINGLNEAFNECSYEESEIILKSLPNKIKGGKEYTLLLNKFLRELYDDVVISQRPWQPCKAAVVELMCCHHLVKDIRITGLEILLANDIGSGVANNDIGSEICEMTGCEWIWDSYPDAQSAEGHRIADPYCPVHGNIFYTDGAKKNLLNKWTELIEEYSPEKIKGANYR